MNNKKVRRIILFSIIFLLIAFSSIISSLMISYEDEYDNILSGIMINEGVVPYKEFFSHHMPAPYFISSVIAKISNTNLLVFKIIWGGLMGTWIFCIFIMMRKVFGISSSIIFTTLTLLSSHMLLSGGLLAETLVGYSVISLAVLTINLFRNNSNPISYKYISLYSLLTSLILLSSLGFIYAGLIFYIIIIYYIYKSKNTRKEKIRFLTILLLPFIFFGTYLLITNSLKDFIFGVFTFNTKYYSYYQYDLEEGLISSTIHAIFRTLKSSLLLLTNLNNVRSSLFLIIIGSSSIFYFSKRQIKTGLLIIVIFIALNIREGGVSEDFAVNFHGMTYYMFSIFCFSILFAEIKENFLKKNNYLINLLLTIVCIFSAIVPVFIVRKGTDGFFNYLENIHNYKEINRTPDPILKLNKLLSKEEYSWVGPFDTFKYIIKLESHFASKYTFYLPWQNICEECNKEIIEDFNRNKPLIIYWKPGVPILNGWKNGTEFKIFQYIEENYFTIEDVNYEGFYFRNEYRDSLLKRIELNNN